MISIRKLMGTMTATLLLVAVLPTFANASLITTSFNFSGLCDDCAGQLVNGGPLRQTGDGIFEAVTGTLVLDNFVPGQQMNSNNFVSFTYDGSSILPSFTVLKANLIGTFQGTLDATGTLLSPIVFEWSTPALTPLGCGASPSCFMQVSLPAQNGSWFIQGVIGDEGINGTFANSVAEPGTLAILSLGLFGLGMARRKRLF